MWIVPIAKSSANSSMMIWNSSTIISNGSMMSGDQLEGNVNRIGPSIRDADIILTPNPSHIEQFPEVSKIWGKEVVLRGIPLERLDIKSNAPRSQ